jgi:acetylornithine deacetylase/succinyl-diaminopimelate desuccinylase-like protein
VAWPTRRAAWAKVVPQAPAEPASRFLRNIGMPIYGVSGIFVDPADYRAHGLDERVEVSRLYDGREFLYRLVKTLAGGG